MRLSWRVVLLSITIGFAALVSVSSASPGLPPRRLLAQAAWSWFADPRSIHFEGARRRTYTGWVTRDGDIEVSAYDHDTGTRTTAMVQRHLEVDDHANPALHIDPDRRLTVFYSRHGGDALYYRTAVYPEDVSEWMPVQTVGTNVPGTRGYTYPNPVYLASERRLYLFWRGGNWNPTFSTREEGQTAWAPAQNLLVGPAGQRPYVKYASSGNDTIHVAFTNAHPSSYANVNVYYARVRDGAIERADGTRIGTLGQPVSPEQADTVWDRPENGWVHDVATDAAGRAVIVFASFPRRDDHRYWYARWTGDRWETHEIVLAGRSLPLDTPTSLYSGGITLDHEDPSVVYLSRAVDGIFEVERWRTKDGGTTWSHAAITANDTADNYRPLSPRGLFSYSGDFGVVWLRGIYHSYVDYLTSLMTLIATAGDAPPVAHAEAGHPGAPAPVGVPFDGTRSLDPDGSIRAWDWDFGDSSRGTGPTVVHSYAAPGDYFVNLTVTDNRGLTDTYVTEVVVPRRAG